MYLFVFELLMIIVVQSLKEGLLLLVDRLLILRGGKVHPHLQLQTQTLLRRPRQRPRQVHIPQAETDVVQLKRLE
jgi:hypothetical protein